MKLKASLENDALKSSPSPDHLVLLVVVQASLLVDVPYLKRHSLGRIQPPDLLGGEREARDSHQRDDER